MTPIDIYLVVWTTKAIALEVSDLVVYTDRWESHGSLDAAQAAHDELLMRNDLYTSSICAVVESTDYDTHPLLEGVK
jgi:hypothetical protein